MNCWHSWCSSNNLRPRPHDTQVQFDQIRRFLKVLDNKFYDKSSPKNWQLFGLLWKTLLLYQKLLWLVLAYLGKNWATLYSNIWSHCMQQRNLVILHATAKSQNLREKVFFEILGQPRPLSFIFQLLLFHKWMPNKSIN